MFQFEMVFRCFCAPLQRSGQAIHLKRGCPNGVVQHLRRPYMTKTKSVLGILLCEAGMALSACASLAALAQSEPGLSIHCRNPSLRGHLALLGSVAARMRLLRCGFRFRTERFRGLWDAISGGGGGATNLVPDTLNPKLENDFRMIPPRHRLGGETHGPSQLQPH